jgi:hypothetical protein
MRKIQNANCVQRGILEMPFYPFYLWQLSRHTKEKLKIISHKTKLTLIPEGGNYSKLFRVSRVVARAS